MLELLSYLAVLGIGYLARVFHMKLTLKDKRIDQKTNLYADLIAQWASTRNYIHRNWELRNERDIQIEFDGLYGNTQRTIAQIYLVTSDKELADKVNDLNEWFYRSHWHELTWDDAYERMNTFKGKAISMVTDMRVDIESETKLGLFGI